MSFNFMAAVTICSDFEAEENTVSHCFHCIFLDLYINLYVMTNLDSILKSRDITLSTKVLLVKAMVFPVMYGCESWTVKKAER